MKLYEIANEIRAIDNMLDSEEITDNQAIDIMQQLEIILKEKSGNVIEYIRDTELDNEKLSSEIKRLQELKKSRESKIDNFKKYVVRMMLQAKYEKIETPFGKMSLRRSESINVEDATQLDKQYLREKITYEADKVKIKEDIKAGCLVEGATIKENYSLIIK